MSRIEFRKLFMSHRMNQDDDPRTLGQNEVIEARNMRSEPDSVTGGYGRKIPGTTLQYSYPYKNSVVISSCENENNNSQILCLYDPDDHHSVVEYYPEDGSYEFLIESAEWLNFKFRNKISSYVIGGMFFFTDGYYDEANTYTFNPPRKVNIERAKNHHSKEYSGSTVTVYSAFQSYSVNDYVIYHEHIYKAVFSHMGYLPTGDTTSNAYWDYVDTWEPESSYLNMSYEITLRHKLPPVSAPDARTGKVEDVSDGEEINFDNGIGSDLRSSKNLLRGKTIWFRYRYIYMDGEKSTWSPISNMFAATQVEDGRGGYVKEGINYNVIGFTFNTGSSDVRKVEIAAKNGYNNNWGLISVIDKVKNNNLRPSPYKWVRLYTEYYYPDSDAYFLYYNDVQSTGLDQEETNLPFHSVPDVSLNNTILHENRQVDSGIIEGHDPVDIDIELDRVYTQKVYEDTWGATELELDPTVVDCETTTSDYRDVFGYIKLYDEVSPGQQYSIDIKLNEIDYDQATGKDVSFKRNVRVYKTVAPGETEDEIVEDLANKINAEVGDTIAYPEICSAPSGNHVYVRTDITLNSGDNQGTVLAFDSSETVVGAVSNPSVTKTHKTGARHPYGIVYFSNSKYYHVNTNSESTIYIPPLYESWNKGELPGSPGNVAFHVVNVGWKINHPPPQWADSYAWVRARNSVSYYLQLRVDSDDIEEDGDYSLVPFNASLTEDKEAHPLVTKEQYVYQQGDRMRVVAKKGKGEGDVWIYPSEQIDFEIRGVWYPDESDDQNVQVEGHYGYQVDGSLGDDRFITDENGNKIREPATQKLKISKVDIAAVNLTGNLLIEVYRGVKEAPDPNSEIYYEIGQRYDIYTHPNGNKYHRGGTADQDPSSPAEGTFEGDQFLRRRTTANDAVGYACEDQSVSDLYDSGFGDLGRPMINQPTVRRKKYGTYIVPSKRYAVNSNINGLCVPVPEDAISLPSQFGDIMSARQVGFVLKLKQPRKMTSVYVGRAGLSQATSEGRQDIVVSTDRLLSNVYPYAEDWGTDSKNVCVNGRYEYFVDINHNAILRDAPNGVVDLTDKYKMKTWFTGLCDQIKLDRGSWEVYIAADNNSDEIIFHFVNSGGTGNPLYSYTIVFYEPDVQGIAAGFVYFMDLEGVDSTKTPQWILSHNNRLYSFIKGDAYHHGGSDDNKFYGSQKEMKVKIPVNPQPLKNTVFESVSVRSLSKMSASNDGDLYIPPSNTTPRGMYSRIPDERFKQLEGKWVSSLLRNSKTSSDSHLVSDLINGDKMRGEYMEMVLSDNNEGGNFLWSVVVRGELSKW